MTLSLAAVCSSSAPAADVDRYVLPAPELQQTSCIHVLDFDRRDRQTDTVPLHRRLPPEAGSVSEEI